MPLLRRIAVPLHCLCSIVKNRSTCSLPNIQLGGLLTGWDVGEAFRAVHTLLPVIYASGRPVDSARVVNGGVFFPKPYKLCAVLTTCKGFF